MLYTSRRPVNLVFSEEFPTRAEAFERERQIKNGVALKKKHLFGRIGQNFLDLQKAHPSTGSGERPRF
jgi:predicted GIY-YIG superfamily endonuclease